MHADSHTRHHTNSRGAEPPTQKGIVGTGHPGGRIPATSQKRMSTITVVSNCSPPWFSLLHPFWKEQIPCVQLPKKKNMLLFSLKCPLESSPFFILIPLLAHSVCLFSSASRKTSLPCLFPFLLPFLLPSSAFFLKAKSDHVSVLFNS